MHKELSLEVVVVVRHDCYSDCKGDESMTVKVTVKRRKTNEHVRARLLGFGVTC